MDNIEWFANYLKAPEEISNKNFAFAKAEIIRAWQLDENIWFKLNQLRQHLTLTKYDDEALVDFCHNLLEN